VARTNERRAAGAASAGQHRHADPGFENGRVLRTLALVAVGVGLAALTAGACLISYDSVHALALQAGVSDSLARVYPVIGDATLVVAGCSVLALRGAGLVSKVYAWLVFMVLLAALAASDVAHAASMSIPKKTAEITAAVLPWALVLLAFGLLLALLRHVKRRRPSHRATGPVAAGAAGAAGTAGAAGAGTAAAAIAPSASVSPGVYAGLGTAAGPAKPVAPTDPTVPSNAVPQQPVVAEVDPEPGTTESAGANDTVPTAAALANAALASTGPAGAGPASTGPASTGPASTGPTSAGPASTGPASAGPASAGPADGGAPRRPSWMPDATMPDLPPVEPVPLEPLPPIPVPSPEPALGPAQEAALEPAQEPVPRPAQEFEPDQLAEPTARLVARPVEMQLRARRQSPATGEPPAPTTAMIPPAPTAPVIPPAPRIPPAPADLGTGEAGSSPARPPVMPPSGVAPPSGLSASNYGGDTVPRGLKVSSPATEQPGDDLTEPQQPAETPVLDRPRSSPIPPSG
jgi:hypothetical protein